MNFPYTTLPGIPKDTKRPLVPIKFINKNRSTLPILSLIDSGADYSYLSTEIADLLEINLSKIKPHQSLGINGSPFTCYPTEITIDIGGHQMDIIAYFSDQLAPAFPCILGQESFFSKTRVVFERYKWNLEIKLK